MVYQKLFNLIKEQILLRKAMNELNITHTVSSAYHPQSQGVIERFHQTLKTIIRTYCVEHQKDWDEQLPTFIVCDSEHSARVLGVQSS